MTRTRGRAHARSRGSSRPCRARDARDSAARHRNDQTSKRGGVAGRRGGGGNRRGRRPAVRASGQRRGALGHDSSVCSSESSPDLRLRTAAIPIDSIGSAASRFDGLVPSTSGIATTTRQPPSTWRATAGPMPSRRRSAAAWPATTTQPRQRHLRPRPRRRADRLRPRRPRLRGVGRGLRREALGTAPRRAGRAARATRPPLEQLRTFVDAYGVLGGSRGASSTPRSTPTTGPMTFVRDALARGHRSFRNHWRKGGRLRAHRTREWIVAHREPMRDALIDVWRR
jgi:hypothetical protein